MVISDAANQVPERIRHLVYLDAMVPLDGETAVDAHAAAQFQVDRALATDSGWRLPPPPIVPGLYGLSEASDLEWLRAMFSDMSVRGLQEPVRLDNPALTAVPRTHIHCVANTDAAAVAASRAVPPIQPNGKPSVVWTLVADHDCMITAPDELAKLLLKLA